MRIDPAMTLEDVIERNRAFEAEQKAYVALEPVTNAVLVQTVGPERKIVISIMLKDEAERENMEKLARIVEHLIIHPSQPFVHPAFPYENPRTPAETEAMLNHMADVHLTATKEKSK